MPAGVTAVPGLGIGASQPDDVVARRPRLRIAVRPSRRRVAGIAFAARRSHCSRSSPRRCSRPCSSKVSSDSTGSISKSARLKTTSTDSGLMSRSSSRPSASSQWRTTASAWCGPTPSPISRRPSTSGVVVSPSGRSLPSEAEVDAAIASEGPTWSQLKPFRARPRDASFPAAGGGPPEHRVAFFDDPRWHVAGWDRSSPGATTARRSATTSGSRGDDSAGRTAGRPAGLHGRRESAGLRCGPVRVGTLQPVDAARYTALGESQRVHSLCFLRSGARSSIETTRTRAHRAQADDLGRPPVDRRPGAAAALLTPILGGDIAALLTGCSRRRLRVRRPADRRHGPATRCRAAPRGVFLIEEPGRASPSGELARSILGRVDIDNIGVSGIEGSYDTRLTGVPGRLLRERDGEGRTIPVGRQSVEPALPGDDLVLTLDRSLQFATEQALLRQVMAVGARGRERSDGPEHRRCVRDGERGVDSETGQPICRARMGPSRQCSSRAPSTRSSPPLRRSRRAGQSGHGSSGARPPPGGRPLVLGSRPAPGHELVGPRHRHALVQHRHDHDGADARQGPSTNTSVASASGRAPLSTFPASRPA